MPDMPESADSSELINIEPNDESALLALSVSADLLSTARTKFGSEDYIGAMDDAKNSIRMAVSSLLYQDGFVSSTMEGMLYYLQKNYSGMFPLEDWRILEKMRPAKGGTLTHALKEFLKIKKNYAETFGDEKLNSETAVKTAEKFVYAVKYLFEARMEEEMGSSEEKQ